MRTRIRNTTLSSIALIVAFLAACADTGDNGESTVADTAAAQTNTQVPAGGMAAQDGNHEFLRMMSDHHEGLVRMATAAMDKGTAPETKNDAHMLHEKQAMERDSMVAMIQRDYQEQYQPKVMPKNQAQADSLNGFSGNEYDRTFYRMTIDHHREGIAMIDQHMGHLTKPEVRQMAEKMKSDQQKEISEFERKMTALR
jgi:uncharacterized protein (DUF305 family)